MASDLIQKALETAKETRAIVTGIDVLDQTGKVFKECFPGAKAILVADGNTWDAAGSEVEASIRAEGIEIEDTYVFPGTPTLYAGYENVEKLREHIRPLEGIVCSIAAGTLNDIAKLASGELGREYMNVCTAASVDGFASFGASITRDGFKITRDCPAPAGLVADYRVMADAPKRLTATGFGDLIEKIPAGADWIISEELGIESIDPYVWSLVQGPLREALSQPKELAAGDPEAIVGLADGNIMSGLAMQAYQSSRPASGAGHQFSHTWEMEGHGLDWEPPLSHGFKVGLGTVAISALYEVVLEKDIANLDIEAAVAKYPTWEATEADIREKQTPALYDAAISQTKAKHLTEEQLRERLTLLKAKWPTIVERITPQLMKADEVREMLKDVGAMYNPTMIDISWERFHKTYYQARQIRSRYTILDVLFDAGLLEECVEALFAPGGYWDVNKEA